MPLGLGFFAVAGAAAAAGAFDLLTTTILTSDTSTVTFSNINNYTAYKHLQIRAVIQDTNASILKITLNNTSAGVTTYATHKLLGDGTSVAAQNSSASDHINLTALPARGNQAETFMAWNIDLLDFSNTSRNKTLRIFGGFAETSNNRIGLFSGLWASTAAVTAITLTPTSGSFASTSRFSLYGIK